MCFNNLTIYTIECISWTIKYMEVKEKYFKTKYRPDGILLNVTAMTNYTYSVENNRVFVLFC